MVFLGAMAADLHVGMPYFKCRRIGAFLLDVYCGSWLGSLVGQRKLIESQGVGVYE